MQGNQDRLEHQALAVYRAQTVLLVEMAHLGLLAATAAMEILVRPASLGRRDQPGRRANQASWEQRARQARLVRLGVPEREASRGLRVVPVSREP